MYACVGNTRRQPLSTETTQDLFPPGHVWHTALLSVLSLLWLLSLLPLLVCSSSTNRTNLETQKPNTASMS